MDEFMSEKLKELFGGRFEWLSLSKFFYRTLLKVSLKLDKLKIEVSKFSLNVIVTKPSGWILEMLAVKI